jgi:hypothetical protein
LKQQYANVKKQGKLQFTFYERNLFVTCSNQIFALIIILIPVEIETERICYKRMKNGRKMVLLENMFPALYGSELNMQFFMTFGLK